MSLDKHVQKAIIEAMNLSRLGVGPQGEVTADKEYIFQYWVDYLWIANIRGYCPHPLYIALSQVRSEHEAQDITHRATLLMEGTDGFLGTHPIRHVTLKDYTDTVAAALRESNLFLATKRYPIDGFYTDPTVTLYTYAPDVFTQLNFTGIPIDPSGAKLWQSLLATLMLLNTAYADQEINTTIRRSPWIMSPE